MSDIGLDIKDMLEDVGTPFDIIRDTGNISDGYLLYKTNAQVTKPFIREFFLETIMSHDTPAVGGDVLAFDDDSGRAFIVMNKTPENIEGECYLNNGVLYKCNVSGELLRPSGEATNENYRARTTWDSIRTECYGLLTPKLFGTDVDNDAPIGRLNLEALNLYTPAKFGVSINDRYSHVSGEYYRVDEIERRSFDGVDVCHLSVDTRE
jgi:hypothetical protein